MFSGYSASALYSIREANVYRGHCHEKNTIYLFSTDIERLYRALWLRSRLWR